jgi:hypothetical protein
MAGFAGSCGALGDIQELPKPVRHFSQKVVVKPDALFRQRLSFYVGEIDATSCLYDERNRGRPTNL